MTWTKLDDRFPWHPKIVGLTDRAFRLYVSSLCYCAAHDTDGELSRPALRILGARPRELEELVNARLLDRDDQDILWVHDYLEYHPTRAQVKANRDSTRERVRNHRQRKQSNTVTGSFQLTESNGVTEELQGVQVSRAGAGRALTSPALSGLDLVPDPDPVPKSPPKDLTESAGVGEPKRAARKRPAAVSRPWPEDFEPDESCVNLATEVSISLPEEIAKARDWALSKGHRCKDWQAFVRNWIRRSAESKRSNSGIRATASEELSLYDRQIIADARAGKLGDKGKQLATESNVARRPRETLDALRRLDRAIQAKGGVILEQAGGKP